MYEVQTYTICDGWVNTWHTDGKPTTFKSFREALEAIDEHLQEMEDEGMDEDRNTYRIKFYELQGKK